MEIPKGRRVTGSEREELSGKLRDQYLAGASIRELAQQTGRSYGFVHRLLVDAEVKLRGRGGATNQRKEAVG